MSQRPKGPGGPPTSSTIPSWSLPHLPEPGLSFNPFPPNTRSSYTPRRPLGACVSICPSVCPTRRHPTLGPGQGLACRRQRDNGSLAAPPVLPCPPHPVQRLRGCSMFYVFLNQDPKATAPYPTPTEALRGTPPEPPTPLPHRPQNLFFF